MTAETPPRPSALCVGPRKSGTSWIHEYLKERGDVALPKGVKETFFFDRYFAKGPDWYMRHFAHARPGQPVVEVAPTYFETLETAARIHKTLGAVPIIVTLRDPARRTFSLYQHLRRYGQIRLPFREAVEAHQLLTGSLYARQLAHWRRTFGTERLHVVFFSDLAADPQAFADALSAVLGLPPCRVPEALLGKFYEGAASPNYHVARITNLVAQTLRSYRLYGVVNWLKNTGLKEIVFGRPDQSAAKPQLSPEDRAWLLDGGLRDDIEALERMLGKDLSSWKEVGDT